MTIFVTVLHVIVCLILIVVVLLQRGKGAEIGAVFGGGGGSTVFGSRGAGNFLTKLTSGAAIVFMFTSLSLAYFVQDRAESSLFEEEAPAAEPASPFQETGEPAPPAEAPAAESPFQEVPSPEAAAPGAATPEPATGEAPAPATP